MDDLSLTPAQIEQFITSGFVRLDEAFPAELADEGRAILWPETGCDPDDPSTWTQPVVRLGGYADPPFVRAANTKRLHAAFDQLVGPGRWVKLGGLGTFPIRFPSTEPPGDDGWHVDMSFMLPEDDPNDFLSWRANITSKNRAILLLFLFSDVGENDAPTRIRAGSHLHIARKLAPAEERGLTLRELAASGFDETEDCEEALATGPAGTVYLCHPFLVHAAQAHRGRTPRFMAQPPLHPAEPLSLHRADRDYSPVELAIRRALDEGAA